MKQNLVLPQLGESVAEAEITEWRVAVGERVEQDAPVAEVATDKVEMDIASPFSGVVVAHLVQVGETVPVGTVIAEIEVD